MKRITSVVLIALMLLSFAACGNSESVSSETPVSNSEAPVQESTPVITEPKLIEDDTTISGTVRFWVPFSEDQGMGDMIAAFNEVYPNITVVLTAYSNNTDGNTAVNTSLMSGEIDVLHSFELHNTYRRWENGLYMDITDAIAADNIDLIENWGSDVYKYSDRIYTLPSGGRAFYVAINMSEWEDAGLGNIPIGWTWDEYLAACEALTHGEGQDKVYGGSQYQSINSVYNTMYQVYGKNALYTDDGMSSAEDPVIQKALAREIQAENVDGIWFPLTTYRADNLQAQQTYLTDRIATSVNTNLVRFIRDTETYPVNFITAFAPYPTEEAGQDNYMEGISVFSHVGIASQCNMRDYDAIYAFLKWYSTYGSKYLAIAGHMPVWSGTDADDMVSLIFGSEAEAAKLIDVESFKRVVCNFDGLSYIDTELTAYSEINSLMQEYVMYAHNGEMTAAEALSALKSLSDQAIAAEK
jgi:multiple sugar transport system substrate-binding protein